MTSGLQQQQKRMSAEMWKNYPHILSHQFRGEVAYRLSGTSPQEMVKQGGWRARSPQLWISNTNTGDNKGFVCFSLLPEVAALFRHTVPHGKTPFLYAVRLFGELYLPGGRWRQVISPGAYPVQEWVARELKEIEPNGRIILGPVLGNQKAFNRTPEERLRDYFENALILPQSLDFGEDLPPEYHIEDSLESLKLQRMLAEYEAETRRDFRY